MTIQKYEFGDGVGISVYVNGKGRFIGITFVPPEGGLYLYNVLADKVVEDCDNDAEAERLLRRGRR